MKYTVQDLQADFPNDDAVLEWLVNFRFPDGVTCKRCEKVTKHYKVKSRKSYSCGVCGWHFHPTAGTIFHKSQVPLTSWMYAIFLMANAKSGISAAQVQRQLGVTYTTAWKLMHKIRTVMEPNGDIVFSKAIEMDEAFFHPNVYKRSSARKKYGPTGQRAGEVIVGMLERETNRVKLWHFHSLKEVYLPQLVEDNVMPGTVVYTDAYLAYRKLGDMGYTHRQTYHNREQFVDEDDPNNNTQRIENFWSHFKRGRRGVYRVMSPKYLLNYGHEYSFRFTYRHHPSLFWALAGRAANWQPS